MREREREKKFRRVLSSFAPRFAKFQRKSPLWVDTAHSSHSTVFRGMYKSSDVLYPPSLKHDYIDLRLHFPIVDEILLVLNCDSQLNVIIV